MCLLYSFIFTAFAIVISPSNVFLRIGSGLFLIAIFSYFLYMNLNLEESIRVEDIRRERKKAQENEKQSRKGLADQGYNSYTEWKKYKSGVKRGYYYKRKL